MAFDDVMKAIQKSKTVPVYLVHGEENYLIDELILALKTQLLSDGAEDFNYHHFFAAETKAATLCDTIETLPMMARARLVVVKGFQTYKDKDLEELYPLIEQPVETTVLVLVADKIDKRKKITKKIKQAGEIVECRRLYENQLSPWIHYIAQKEGLSMEPAAVNLLQQAVGSSLSEIRNEIKKIHLYLGDRTQILVDDVRRVVSQSRLQSVFELANAIGGCDKVQALVRLAHLLDQGQNEIGVLAMISRHFRILVDIREGMKQGLRGAKLSQRVGVHPFFLKQYVDQSQNWSEVRLKQTYQALLETDRALKSSPLSSHIWLENFVLQTCS